MLLMPTSSPVGFHFLSQLDRHRNRNREREESRDWGRVGYDLLSLQLVEGFACLQVGLFGDGIRRNRWGRLKFFI